MVYVRLEEMNTGVGDAVIESDRSASPVISTSTEVMVALFEATGSVVCEVTSAELTIDVPAAAAALTVTTNVKFPVVVLLAMAALAEHKTVPVPPTAGAVPQVHPAGGVTEAKVVLGGVR
jgi:hypothetical protein